MNLVFGLPVAAIASALTWYGLSSLMRSVQTSLRLAHRDPHVGVQEVGALDALLDDVGEGDPRARLRGDLAGLRRRAPRRGQRILGRDQPDVHAQLRAADDQRVAHVVARRRPGTRTRSASSGLLRVLAHGQDVGQDLGRVELVGQAVPDRHAGVVGEGLDDVLVEAAVLDAVVEPAEHPRGVLDRSPCGPSATTAGRGRSRARPGRRPRPRTSSACASRSSRRSGRSPSGGGARPRCRPSWPP